MLFRRVVIEFLMKHPPVYLAVLVAAAIGSANADTINQVHSDGSGESWLNPNTWAGNTSVAAGNDYVSGPGMVIRSPGTTDSVFSGDSLTLNGSQFSLVGNVGAASTVTIADLRASGAVFSNASGGNKTQTLNGALTVSGTNYFRLNTSATARSITVSSQISGEGTIGLMQNGTLTLNGAGNTFSGLWSVGGTNVSILGTSYSNTSSLKSVLDAASGGSLGVNSSLLVSDYGIVHVDYDWITTGSVTLNLNGLVFLDTDWTVGALTINGTTLGPGVYSYDSLNTAYDAYFDATGAGGSITVIPEPGSSALLLLGFCGTALLFVRRPGKSGVI